MNFTTDRSKEVTDLQLKQFIDIASANQKFQSLVHGLTEICWDTCVDRPTARLETKTERCLVNCLERFIDTTNYITNRLEKVALSSGSSFESE